MAQKNALRTAARQLRGFGVDPEVIVLLKKLAAHHMEANWTTIQPDDLVEAKKNLRVNGATRKGEFDVYELGTKYEDTTDPDLTQYATANFTVMIKDDLE